MSWESKRQDFKAYVKAVPAMWKDHRIDHAYMNFWVESCRFHSQKRPGYFFGHVLGYAFPLNAILFTLALIY